MKVTPNDNPKPSRQVERMKRGIERKFGKWEKTVIPNEVTQGVFRRKGNEQTITLKDKTIKTGSDDPTINKLTETLNGEIRNTQNSLRGRIKKSQKGL